MSGCRTGGMGLCAGAVFLGLAGCDGGGSRRYAVSGEVKFPGKPLDQGAITFVAQDPALGSGGGAQIKGGHDDIPAAHGLLPGKYRVMITGTSSACGISPRARGSSTPPRRTPACASFRSPEGEPQAAWHRET